MSLNDAIIEMNDVVFDSETGFAETITYVPQGVTANQFELTANVYWDDEEGNNQIRGDGRANMNQDRGRSLRHSIEIDLPNWREDESGETVPVIVNTNGSDRIIVKKHGTTQTVSLAVKRITGRDIAVQTVLCSFGTEHAPQRRKSRFG